MKPACLSIRLRQAVSHFVRVIVWVSKVRCQPSCVVVYRWSRTEISAAVTVRYVVALEQRDVERSCLRRHWNDETPKHADSRQSAQCECQQRRWYLEMLEQTHARHAVERIRSQRRRNAAEQTDCQLAVDCSRFIVFCRAVCRAVLNFQTKERP